MNERIKEMALKCGAWNQVYPPNKFMHDRTFDIEKFAELIVKECAGLHTKNIIVGGGTDYNRGRRMLAEDILKHFGVE